MKQKFFEEESIPGRDFYIPHSRQELVKWLYDHCKKTGKKPKNFYDMKKQQLYAIYFSIRKKEKKEESKFYKFLFFLF